jgi:peptide-methionine (R)-S-oxide reductase
MTENDMNEEDLKAKLTPEEYHVLREKGTEAPFSGEYVDHSDAGVYRCKVCGNVLFTSADKVDSRESEPGLRGWPSFTNPAVSENIGLRPDDSGGMHRTEVYCKHCNSHLGHVFDEHVKGEERKHYCINSVCLEFEKKD